MDPLHRGDAIDARQAYVDQDDLRVQSRDRFERLLAGLGRADELEIVEVSKQQIQSLADDRMVVNAETASPRGHWTDVNAI